MKSLKSIWHIILLLLFSNTLIAQTYNNSQSLGSADITLQNIQQLNVLNSQNTPSNRLRNQEIRNRVNIQQVGIQNDIYTNTISQSSSINLFQFGGNNEIVLGVKARAIQENIIQTGFNNAVLDLSPSTTQLHRSQVVQSGTNQRLIWLGSNSISEKLMVRMQGRKQTVLIRSLR